MIFHSRRVFLPMVALLATASIAIAQAPASTRVRVRSAEGAPVAGALVALLEGGGRIEWNTAAASVPPRPRMKSKA